MCGKGREWWCQRIMVNMDVTQDSQTITPAIEDYIKAIALLQREQSKATTNLVAAQMNVRAASVTKIFHRLQQLGLIVYVPYYGASLTEAGHQLAHEVLWRNQLVRQFFVQVLGLSPDEVQADADMLEHVISDALGQRMAAYLGWHSGRKDTQTR